MPDDNGTTTPEPEADDTSPCPPKLTGRRGDVAKLPYKLRHQLGLMLLDSVPYAETIKRLGEPANQLNAEQIRAWKRFGGFEAWKDNYFAKDAVEGTAAQAADLNEQKPAT